MAWYNITCRSGGSNMNAGCTDGVGECDVSPLLTNTNGAWDNTTGVFTCSGAPDLSGLVVGHRCALAFDADTVPATNRYLTGVISAVDNTAKTITLTNRNALGTLSTAASGITARVGGALQGPTAASSQPLNLGFLQSTGNTVRVNLKNDQTYNVTAGVAWSATTILRVQGYTSTFGDGGKFILDGGTSGASYTLLTMSVGNSELYDAEIRNNGATGNAAGLSVTGALCDLFRVTVHDVRGTGVSQATGRVTSNEVRAYNCNQSNTANLAGFSTFSNVPTLWVRSVSHDNSGSNTYGFFQNSTSLHYLRDCVFETNGVSGVVCTAGGSVYFVATGCDCYANGASGLLLTNTGSTNAFYAFITDCNLVANGGYGVAGSGASFKSGFLQNCGFGSGTAANTSGATNALGDIRVSGSVTYAANATPWADPAAGDFTITLGQAKATGTGIVAGSTQSRPDRGAAQNAPAAAGSGGSGGVVSSGF